MNFNLREISNKLSTRGWLAVGGAFVVGIVFIYLLLSLASSPSYTTLTAGQSPAQTGKITAALSAAGIAYELQNGGTAVAVQSSQESQARVTLDEQGLLLGTGGSSTSLTSLLGSTSLGESNFQQQEQYTSALEQQLNQAIEQMNGINSATVELNIPDETDNLFSGTNAQASASVLLSTEGTLGSTEVKAIASQVSDAIQGLSTSRVTISDQNGDLLWPTSSTSGTSTGLTAKTSAQQAYDTQTAMTADAMLAAAFGPNKAIVQVNANLDTNQQQVDSVTYGKNGPPLTANTTNEKLTGNGVTPSGTAGNTATQIAGYAGTTGTGKTNYSNKTNNSTYGVNKTVTQTTVAPGTVNRQSISVLVNSSVPATEIPTIQNAVQNAVGYVAGRDSISVGTATFPKVVPVAASSSTSKTLGDLKYVLVAIGVLLFLFFMSRLLRRREADQFAGRPTWLRELELPRSLSQLEAETQMVDLNPPAVISRLRPPVNVARQQVEELVDRDPERVASQIRQWMTED